MDSKSGDQQKIRNLQASGHLRARSLVQISEFTGSKDCDFEDLFDVDFYLKLVNGAYGISPELTESDLANKSPRVVVRIGKAFEQKQIANGTLNHLRPASFLLRNQDAYLSKLSEANLQNVSDLFDRLNTLVE